MKSKVTLILSILSVFVLTLIAPIRANAQYYYSPNPNYQNYRQRRREWRRERDWRQERDWRRHEWRERHGYQYYRQ